MIQKLKRVGEKVLFGIVYLSIAFIMAPTLMQRWKEENPEAYRKLPWYHKVWGIFLISLLISLIIIGGLFLLT